MASHLYSCEQDESAVVISSKIKIDSQELIDESTDLSSETRKAVLPYFDPKFDCVDLTDKLTGPNQGYLGESTGPTIQTESSQSTQQESNQSTHPQSNKSTKADKAEDTGTQMEWIKKKLSELWDKIKKGKIHN